MTTTATYRLARFGMELAGWKIVGSGSLYMPISANGAGQNWPFETWQKGDRFLLIRCEPDGKFTAYFPEENGNNFLANLT